MADHPAPQRRRTSKTPALLGLALLLLAGTGARAGEIRGPVRLADGTQCGLVDGLFGINASPATVQLSGSDGTQRATLVDEAGEYRFDGLSPGASVTYTVSAQCTPGVQATERVIVIPRIGSGGGVLPFDVRIPLSLPNRQPVVTLTAAFNGQAVTGVPPGATVRVVGRAQDADGDALTFEWRAAAGTVALVAGTPSSVRWTLPPGPGVHFLYALVHDGRGGYRRATLALSTDASVVPRPTQAAAPAPARVADGVPGGEHFLSYKGIDTARSACEYYSAIRAYLPPIGFDSVCDANGRPQFGGRLTFSSWRSSVGLGGNGMASARYANLVDLNLQRDMHGATSRGERPNRNGDVPWPGVDQPSCTTTRSCGLGTNVAYYVCNHPNTDNALSNVVGGRNLVACVAMEYSVTFDATTGGYLNGGNPFTKFYVFGPDGNLLPSVNLDGRGEKFVPGTCTVCHGGTQSPFPTNAPANRSAVDLQASFLPFDLDNYRFVGGLGRQGATAAEQDNLRRLNEMILKTQPRPAVASLVKGWYASDASGALVGNFIGTGHVPPGWAGHERFYNEVVAPNCRTCHVAFGADWSSAAQFDAYAASVSSKVCGNGIGEAKRYSMPNALETFERFWNSSAPGLLAQRLGTDCNPPPR